MFNNNYINNIPPVTKNLIMVNLVVFVVMMLVPEQKEELITRYGSLHYFSSPDFNMAQLITYMFIHGGFAHFFFNMFTLFMFGPQIEWALGSKRFLFYYLSCGIGAALVQEGVYAIMIQKYAAFFTPDQFEEIIHEGAAALHKHMNFTNPTYAALNLLVNGSTVGASGAIYGVLLAFGMLYPNREIMLLIPPMPLKAKWLVIGYGVIELVLGLSSRGDGVAHFCHLGGMIFGVLIILYWKKKGTFNGFY